jgi:hypothetical protein
MVDIASLTIGDIFRLRIKILNEYDIFTLGKKAIAKVFLQKLLNLDETTSFTEVEQAFINSTCRTNVPNGVDKFWDYIAKEYLQLETEPRDKFLEVSFQVSADLSKIAANLKYITEERKALEDKKHLSADERYYRNQLDYFKNKNLVARDEIINFMADGVKRYAMNEASSGNKMFGLSSSLFKRAPYAFRNPFSRVLGDPYDVHSLNELTNKFDDLPLNTHKKIMDAFRDKPELIKEFSLAYIKGIPDEGVLSAKEKLEKLVAGSHLLNRRRQVICTMLNHFDAKDYISFVSMAPLQIEGIFADICKEIGVSERQLDISSLNDKLQHIEGKINSFFYFEYYSFKFPVLRNLVAHGGLVDGELEDIAIKLMLDLLPVCALADSEELPINHAIKVINMACKKDFAKLIEWLDLSDKVTIPDFYGIQEMIASAEALYSAQEFWDYLVAQLKKLNKEDEIKECVPIKVAGKLKKRGFAKEQCEQFLKRAKKVAQESIQTREKNVENFKRILNLKTT